MGFDNRSNMKNEEEKKEQQTTFSFLRSKLDSFGEMISSKIAPKKENEQSLSFKYDSNKSLEIVEHFHELAKKIIFEDGPEFDNNILIQMTKLMILSCNKHMLWKKYDQMYLQQIGLLFGISQ